MARCRSSPRVPPLTSRRQGSTEADGCRAPHRLLAASRSEGGSDRAAAKRRRTADPASAPPPAAADSPEGGRPASESQATSVAPRLPVPSAVDFSLPGCLRHPGYEPHRDSWHPYQQRQQCRGERLQPPQDSWPSVANSLHHAARCATAHPAAVTAALRVSSAGAGPAFAGSAPAVARAAAGGASDAGWPGPSPAPAPEEPHAGAVPPACRAAADASERAALRIVDVDAAQLEWVVRVIRLAGAVGSSVPAVIIQPAAGGEGSMPPPAPPPSGYVRKMYQLPNGSVVLGEEKRIADAGSHLTSAAMVVAAAAAADGGALLQPPGACEAASRKPGRRHGEWGDHGDRGGGGGATDCGYGGSPPPPWAQGEHDDSIPAEQEEEKDTVAAGPANVAAAPAVAAAAAGAAPCAPWQRMPPPPQLHLQLPTGLVLAPLRCPPPGLLDATPLGQQRQQQHQHDADRLGASGVDGAGGCGHATCAESGAAAVREAVGRRSVDGLDFKIYFAGEAGAGPQRLQQELGDCAGSSDGLAAQQTVPTAPFQLLPSPRGEKEQDRQMAGQH